jgi:hypothetical protein
MDNGKKFEISAEDAEFDGYTLVDSYDAIAKEEVK